MILGYQITLVNGFSHKPRDTCAINCTPQGACCRKDCVGTYLCSLHHVLSVNQMSHCNDNLVSDVPCSLFVVFLYKTTKSVWREVSSMLIALLNNLLYSWIAWGSKCHSSAASNVSISLVLTLLKTLNGGNSSAINEK